MEATKVLLPAHEMTTAQCVMECSGYLRTIANQEFEGEDWQTAPKLRRRNLLTDFLGCTELSGEEFAELCGLIGFQLSKTTTAKLAKFTVIAYDWQSEANGEATPDILAALDKCEGVTLIEQRGYRPQARTYDLLRFHIAAFWRCLVNELRSLCLGVGLVVYPKEIPATPTETPRISTETAETVNVLVNGEKETEREEIEVQTIADMVAIGESLNKGESVSFKLHLHFLWSVTITNESAEWCEEFKYSLNAKCLDNPQSFGRRYTSFGLAILHCLNQFNENVNIRDDYETLSAVLNNHQNLISDFRAPQSPETPQAVECAAEPCKLAQTA